MTARGVETTMMGGRTAGTRREALRARVAKTVGGARMVGARTVGARMVGSGVEGATPAVVAMTMRAAIARTLTRLAGGMTVPAQSVPQI